MNTYETLRHTAVEHFEAIVQCTRSLPPAVATEALARLRADLERLSHIVEARLRITLMQAPYLSEPEGFTTPEVRIAVASIAKLAVQPSLRASATKFLLALAATSESPLKVQVASTATGIELNTPECRLGKRWIIEPCRVAWPAVNVTRYWTDSSGAVGVSRHFLVNDALKLSVCRPPSDALRGPMRFDLNFHPQLTCFTATATSDRELSQVFLDVRNSEDCCWAAYSTGGVYNRYGDPPRLGEHAASRAEKLLHEGANSSVKARWVEIFSACEKDSTKVVLIDSIEHELHPKYQQTVVDFLLAEFPRVRFVVTTRSPIVLSTIDHKQIRVLCMRVPTNEEDESAEDAEPELCVRMLHSQTRGVDCGDLLSQILGVDPIPNIPEVRALRDYQNEIEQGDPRSPEALALRARLEQHFGSMHQVLRDCDTSIRFNDFKNKRRT